MSIPRADCASSLDLRRLQPAELQALFAALVDSEEDPGLLLRAAAKQLLVPEALRTAPDWTKRVRIVHNIMLPDPGAEFPVQHIELPMCVLELRLRRFMTQGKAVCEPIPSVLEIDLFG